MSDQLVLFLWLSGPPLAGELIFLFLAFLYFRKRKSKPSRGQMVGISLASVVLLTFLAFGGGESYYRCVFDGTDAMACTKLSQRWVDRYFVANDAGFRDNVRYRVSLTPGVRRVSFVGDSFTAGHGIKRVDDRFANLIRAAYPEWEVHVLAKPGSDTGAELERLQGLREVNYPVDVVVLVYCLNDVADLYPEWTATVGRIYEDPSRRNWFVRNSFFLDLLYNRIRLSREPYAKDYYSFVREGYRDAVWERQKERLRTMSELVRTNGGRFLVVTFPFLHKLGTDYEYQFAHEELNRFWAEQHVPHLDLYPAFTNLPPGNLVVNPRDPHPNEYTNRVAAEIIGPFIATNLGRSR